MNITESIMIMTIFIGTTILTITKIAICNVVVVQICSFY